MLKSRHCPYDDPVRVAYRRYRRAFINLAVVLMLLAAGLCLRGVPHLQTTYEYYGPERSGGVPASQKVSAWYVSVTGFKKVRSGQYGHDGCPALIFVPLEDCFD